MHLYYYAQDKADKTKICELLTLETAARASGDDKSDAPEPEGFGRQVNFIFRTINGVNAVIGLIFFISGAVIFFGFRTPQADFGSGAFVVVSFVMGLSGVAFCIFSALGLILNIRSFQQILLYGIGGGFVFIATILACAVRIPSTSVLLGNVTSEMSESLYLSKDGDQIQLGKWNSVQASLHCCGVSNYLDWCEPKNVTQERQGITRQCKVPESCFSNSSSHSQSPSVIRADIDPRRPIFLRGCYSLQMEVLHMNVNLYRSIGYLMIILLGFATVFAVFVIMVIHR